MLRRSAGFSSYNALIAIFFLLGSLSFAGSFFVLKYDRAHFLRQEPYFALPLTEASNIIRLRSDAFGKGYFGASRNGNRTHEGIDILAPLATPILASKSGRVSYAGEGKGYGFYVEIAHPDGRKSRYAHLSQILAQTGQWVCASERIGLSGKTGNAASSKIKPHLHFEIREGAKALDPANGLLDPSISIQ